MKTSNFIKLIMLFAMLAAIFINNRVYADENFTETGPEDSMLFTESGIITGFGGGHIDEGNYQPVLLIWHLGIDLNGFLHAPKDCKGKFSLYFEPQINPVVNPETDIECGIRLGFKFMYPITESLSTYILGGAGPHYISVKTKKTGQRFCVFRYHWSWILLFHHEKISRQHGIQIPAYVQYRYVSSQLRH